MTSTTERKRRDLSVESWKVDLPEGTSGDVEVRRFEVPELSVGGLRAMLQGRGITPGWFTGLYRRGGLWMSDTDAEQRDCWDADREIWRRGGRVLVMGLGLGMIVKRALSYPNVEHVDVVEIDPDVVRLVGPSYAGERCTIHTGDALTFKWPPGTRWTVAWHDIWQDICEDNLPEMAKLARSYARRTDWQGFWSKDLILAHRRQTANAWWR